MAIDLPAPKVPGLQQPGNYIDLDQLGSADLLTYIDYPGIGEGDLFYPNWRGCGRNGEVADFFGDLLEVTNPVAEGMPLMIKNELLQRLDQGWVFYSYQLPDPDQTDEWMESARLFFYVGKQPGSETALAVAQCKESHDLKVDPDLLGTVSNVLVVVPPYRAMRAGDNVILTLDLYYDANNPPQSLVLKHEVTESEVGQPLQWKIDSNELLAIEGGYALMSYEIEYVDSTASTFSPVQTLQVVSPVVALLPALAIKDFNGGSLDPQAFPDGITLQISPYPGMWIDDDVVVYIKSDSRVVKSLRTDVSTLDSQVLEFKVGFDWLVSNNGKQVEFMYQYARQDAAGSSLARTVTLRQPLDLPPPEIAQATVESGSEEGVAGYAFATDMTGGVQIRIPKEAVIGANDKVQMHWNGYGGTGSFIADPSPSDPRLFVIPATAVPANMGKRLDVYYEVTPAGELPGTSKVFDLQVRGIDGNWPVIQIMRPRTTDGWLVLANVAPGGAGLDLASWTYMAQGQRVRVKAQGLSQAGEVQTFNVRTGSQEPVTAAEMQAGVVSVLISKDSLEQLQPDTETNNVTVEVSFDEGASYVQFPSIRFGLKRQ